MKVLYTGRHEELSDLHRKKLDSRFAKLGKMLDGRDEKEAHVILGNERHLKVAEVTVRHYDHTLVGVGTDSDLFTALNSALEKIEKQYLRQSEKWRDTKRTPREKVVAAVPATGVEEPLEEEDELSAGGEPRVLRVDTNASRKPMTLDEAVLEMEKDRDFVVYRDAETDRVSVLLRRRDGNFALIEA
jgi:putative sigma-54 modulation protein